MISSLIDALLSLIHSLGYLGIFLGMTLESSFFPFPSEVILIPAGTLIAQGNLDLFWTFFFAVAGSTLGALINYLLALFIGRTFIEAYIDRYGRLLFISRGGLKKAEDYFEKYGDVTTLLGRLIFGVRQLISIPAGLAKMNLPKFLFYTSLGSSVWSAILISIGYIFGNSGNSLMNLISLLLVIVAVIVTLIYYLRISYSQRTLQP